MPDDIHEIYAIRYGHHSRRSPANFIDGDPHDILQPLDFFVWAIVGTSGVIVVDTGVPQRLTAGVIAWAIMTPRACELW